MLDGTLYGQFGEVTRQTLKLGIMAVPIMWFSSSSISKSVLRQFLDSMVQPTIDRKYALAA